MKVVENPEGNEHDVIESKITAQEEPLPELTEAFAALNEPFCHVLEVPTKWGTGLNIDKLTILRTKQGTRSVIMAGSKQLETRAEFRHPIAAPCIQIDKSADGESGQVPIAKKHVDIILEAVAQAEKYMAGDRSQKLLNFEQSKAGLQALADKGKEELGLEANG